jgi:hypothetical protein
MECPFCLFSGLHQSLISRNVGLKPGDCRMSATTKSDKIKAALISGDKVRAISIASKFFDRSEDTRLYQQAQSAANNPAFYRQIGKDPEAIVDAAVAALSHRFL